MSAKSSPHPLQAEALAALQSSGIRHGYFTREGGVSEGLYAGLNTGVGSSDDPARVAENRSRVATWMGVAPDRLLTVHQVHSPDAITVSQPFPGERPKADAIVTATPGLAICASSADCGPVLFADAHARVIGAAHAGWKGALTGVLEAAIDAMQALGAERSRIIAVLGPSITQKNYEVGAEFVERFTADAPHNLHYFTPSIRSGHSMFDLNAYTVDRLNAAGVSASALNRCTYGEPELFYSYRRSTHLNEPDYGRHVASIVLENR